MDIFCKKGVIPTLSNLKEVNVKIKGSDDIVNITVQNNVTTFKTGSVQLAVVFTASNVHKKCNELHANEVHPIWKDTFFIISIFMITTIVIVYFIYDINVIFH